MPALRATSPRSRSLPRAVAFWVVGATVVALLAASSAPSPLYPIYQQEFGFSSIELTTIFAVYVLALLISLLTVGRLSDHVGRRPVLAGALTVQALAMVAFLVAGGTGWLLVARVVQGLATGAAVGVLGAYLLDLQPPDGSRLGSLVNSVAPGIGLGIGALGTGLLVQYAPHPTRLVFAILLADVLVLILVTTILPETVRPVPGAVASLRPQVAVPGPARRAFAAATPSMVATWALGGLVLSIGGSVIRSVFAESNSAVVGLVLGVFACTGALTGVLVTSWTPAAIQRYGTVTLVLGTAVFITALAVSSLPLFVIASVVAGSGFGAGFLGALRSLTQLVQPHERAGLLSAVYVVSYLAFSIPALVAGLLITRIGLRDTALYYGGFVALAALTSLVISLLATRPAAPAAAELVSPAR